MQISIVKKSAAVGDFRIDPECYQEKYISIERKLSTLKHTLLGKEVSKFYKGIFDIKADNYSDSGIPFVRIGDLKDSTIDLSNITYISELEHLKNHKTALRRGDIILSKTAYPAASFVDLDECNTSQDTIALRLKENSQIESEYLVVFLNSKFGFNQMERWFTGNVQMHLNLSDSRNIIIPVLTEDMRNKIKTLFFSTIRLKKQSVMKFNQAQTLLLSELGLVDWRPKHRLTFVKNYSDAERVTRIDAEYFQPKYEEIVQIVKSYSGGWNTMENLVHLKSKNSRPAEKKEYKYIALANIVSNGGITNCVMKEGQNLPSRARRKVTIEDVIVSSIEGSLSSIALISKEYNQALCSTGFHVISSKMFNSETLLVLMKSIIGQLQLKKGCSGTILTAINKNEFNQIVLPIIADEKQAQIQQKVIDSFDLREQSKYLLECAKRAVEIAIEQDEQTATDWLTSLQL